MKWTILIISVLFLLSCNKERTLQISAKNAVTGAPYPGLTYFVVEEKTGSNGEEFTTVSTGALDSNGEKRVNLKIKKNRSYTIRVEEPPNWCYNKQISYSYAIQDEENPNFVFEFAECATLQRKVTNTSCFDVNDKIEIYIDNSVQSLLSAPWILNGCVNYTTNQTQVPIGNYNLRWLVTKNGTTTEYLDSFNLSENEIKLYEINY